jgi:hypothetical protein
VVQGLKSYGRREAVSEVLRTKPSYGRREVVSDLRATFGHPSLCDLCCGLSGPFVAKQDVADSVGADSDVEPFRSCYYGLVERHARSVVEE